MHCHFLGSMFVVVVDVGKTALGRQVVGSHLAWLYEVYEWGMKRDAARVARV